MYRRLFSGLTQKHEAAQISSEQFYREAQQLLGISDLTFIDFSRIWRNIFSENLGIESLIGHIATDSKLGIVSNTDPIHWETIRELPVMKRFFSDPVCITRSFDVGTRKPDPRIWQHALARLGCSAEQTLYIDDIDDYVDAFEKLGGHAIQYDCSRDSIEVLARAIGRYGLLVP